MNLPQAADLLKSLEPEEGLRYRLLIPHQDHWQEGDDVAEITNLLPNEMPRWVVLRREPPYYNMIGRPVSPLYIGRRAESLQIPDLKEKVKAFARAVVEAERAYADSPDSPKKEMVARSFRALCAPTEVTNGDN